MSQALEKNLQSDHAKLNLSTLTKIFEQLKHPAIQRVNFEINEKITTVCYFHPLKDEPPNPSPGKGVTITFELPEYVKTGYYDVHTARQDYVFHSAAEVAKHFVENEQYAYGKIESVELRHPTTGQTKWVFPDELNGHHETIAKQLNSLETRLRTFTLNENRLSHAEDWLKTIDSLTAKINEMDKPHNKAIRLVNKELQREYKESLNHLEKARTILKHFHVKDHDDLEAQKNNHLRESQDIPSLREEINQLKAGFRWLSETLRSVSYIERLFSSGREERHHEYDR